MIIFSSIIYYFQPLYHLSKSIFGNVFKMQYYYKRKLEISFSVTNLTYYCSLYIMNNIFDFLLVPATNEMYEGVARVHFIFAGTSKKSKCYTLYG